MGLELRYLEIKDVVFGQDTTLDGTTLIIDRGTLRYRHAKELNFAGVILPNEPVSLTAKINAEAGAAQKFLTSIPEALLQPHISPMTLAIPLPSR